MLSRRQLGLGAAGLALSACAQGPKGQAANLKTPGAEAKFSDTKWANMTEAEWKERLTEDEFHILREAGTEPPRSSPLLEEKRKGTYVCAGCALPLFKSETKFHSGTGWPSFYNYIEGNLGMMEDNTLFSKRTEYHCARCKGHQGHVFKDGPPPTGLRYCNDGLSLDFEPA